MRPFCLVLGLGLAATAALAAPRSPLQSASEFAGCKWVVAKAGAATLGGFDCIRGANATRLVGDAALPGFWLEAKGPEGVDRRIALRLFTKPDKASLPSILAQVRKASPGPATTACRFAPYPAKPYPGAMAFALAPTGAAKKAFDAGESDDPCGPLGVGQASDRYFYLAKGRPDVVVMVDLGSEIQPFDPATLTLGARSK